MGKRGPRKEPVELKLLKGTFRSDRDNKNIPKPIPVAPKCPSWLPAKAKRLWNRLAPKLEQLALLREIDCDEFTRYVLATIRQRQAEEDIERRGILVPGAVPGSVVKNPSVQIARDYGIVASRLADKFGLSPSARASLPKTEGVDDPDDPLECLLRDSEKRVYRP